MLLFLPLPFLIELFPPVPGNVLTFLVLRWNAFVIPNTIFIHVFLSPEHLKMTQFASMGFLGSLLGSLLFPLLLCSLLLRFSSFLLVLCNSQVSCDWSYYYNNLNVSPMFPIKIKKKKNNILVYVLTSWLIAFPVFEVNIQIEQIHIAYAIGELEYLGCK